MTLLTSVPRDTWKPEVGDRLIVDTNDNMGYLIHPDGVYLEFKVATGQRRVVRYIGRTYDATTPEESWVAKSLHIKADRITFGPNGHFPRDSIVIARQTLPTASTGTPIVSGCSLKTSVSRVWAA